AMQRASELAIQAGSGALSAPDRVSIAAEIGEIEKSVFGMLNSKDANGGYLFAGSKSSTPPYVRNGDGTYSYQGDQTQLSVQVSDTLRMAT
ncbi:flagellar hook-associated protein FlgL, partial [Pseudomonas neuropathica]